MPHATINGARLWYDDQGQGEPILLHHGYTASRANWMPVAERLGAKPQRYRVILMECRGAGESEHTAGGYTLEQYAADVIGLLDHLGIDRVTFAGHSMGGGVGYLLALDHAQRLERLVLMAPIPSGGIGTIDPELRAARIDERRRRDRASIYARYQAMRFREDVETDAWFAFRADEILSVSDGHFESGAEAMQALNVSERLSSLHTPTLMISGAVDSLLTANLEDFLRLPNATLEVLSRAGHEVAVHEPARVTEAIENFITHGVVTAATLQARLAG